MLLALFRRIISYKFFPLSWTLLTIILLCLPGSIVPGQGFFAIENLDKIIHVVIFGMNVLFWGWHYQTAEYSPAAKRWIILGATLSMIALGVVMEYVQLYFIPNRSFDSWDIVADAVGSILAGLWLLRS